MQFARYLRGKRGIAGRETEPSDPHKVAAQTTQNNGNDQIARGTAQLQSNQHAKRSAAQTPREAPQKFSTFRQLWDWEEWHEEYLLRGLDLVAVPSNGPQAS